MAANSLDYHETLARLRETYGQTDVLAVPEIEEPTSPERSFLTEVDNRLLFVAPTYVGAELANSRTSHPAFLWLGGRFVGADVPNANGAFWASSELSMAMPTVQHGPVNWLHEGKRVIGTIAGAEMVQRPEQSALAGQQVEPHIAVTAAVWKWLYPGEAAVLEMASEQRKLWFSMECVAEEVACMAPECGQVFPYQQTMTERSSCCEHIQNRSAARDFRGSTFLGGAVIVPPTQPGWAKANAEVMKDVESAAALTYEMSHSQMSASEWELLMGAVVLSARS